MASFSEPHEAWGTHAVAFGGEKDGVAVQRKVGIAAHVAAIGEVDDVFASLCADQADVGVGSCLLPVNSSVNHLPSGDHA